jgi:hypothetical protein
VCAGRQGAADRQKDDEKEVDIGAAGTVKTIDTDASELTGH